jgi:hypothetical protein
MKPKIILRLLWLGACIAALSLYDADIVFAYAILILTFPVSILVQGLIALFDISIPGGFRASIVIWFVFVITGYLQWFVALPWAIKRLKISMVREKES